MSFTSPTSVNMFRGTFQKWYTYSQAPTAMVLVQLLSTGLQLLSRVVLKQGIFVFALMTYRSIVAAVSLAPLAFYSERDIRNKLTWRVYLWLFLNGSFGISFSMGFFNFGLRDTTAGYAVNFLNLLPVVTFVLAVIVGLEKLGLKTKAGQLKVVGAILSTGGALTVGLYKGGKFHIGHQRIHQAATLASNNDQQHWTRGSLLLSASCVSFAIWYIVQAKLMKVFPYKYWATMLSCVIASVQAAVVGVCVDHRMQAWKLGWDIQLGTIIYSGVVGTAGVISLVSWAVSTQGPAYPPMFNPLLLISVAFFEALILGEVITAGSLIGMVLIIVGLYSFLWGRRKESTNLPAPTAAASQEGAAPVVVAVCNLQMLPQWQSISTSSVNRRYMMRHRRRCSRSRKSRPSSME